MEPLSASASRGPFVTWNLVSLHPFQWGISSLCNRPLPGEPWWSPSLLPCCELLAFYFVSQKACVPCPCSPSPMEGTGMCPSFRRLLTQPCASNPKPHGTHSPHLTCLFVPNLCLRSYLSWKLRSTAPVVGRAALILYQPLNSDLLSLVSGLCICI